MMKIFALNYAYSVLPEDGVFKGGSPENYVLISFLMYLIKTEDKIILVDAGCETLGGFELKDLISPRKAVENAGVSTDDITDLIITHAHHDHIACASYFKNATVYIQSDEYEKGKGYLKESKKVVTFDDKYKICDGVEVIKIGGHSIGSCIVEVDAGEKTYVITGDECYSRRCLDEHICAGAPYSVENNQKFIEKYSDTDKYVSLVSHDPDYQSEYKVPYSE